jgi:hypothetical protein
MAQLGIGVMIKMLGGDERTATIVQSALGKTIEKVWLDEDVLKFTFTDGSGIGIYDDGQSCCEYRHMTTDDNLEEFAGAKLLGLELKDAPDVDDGYTVHEVQFLDIQTDKGVFQMANHNEHNGYYGGFYVVAKIL